MVSIIARPQNCDPVQETVCPTWLGVRVRGEGWRGGGVRGEV